MKKRKNILIIIAIIVLLLSACVIWQHKVVNVVVQNLLSPSVKLDTTAWTGGTSWEGVSYSDISDADYLNLYVPDSAEPMPLLVLVHGGGFITNDCESRQAQFMYRYFRQHGYACASVNYRLSTEAPYPAALEDVKAAVRYLRANAQQYGYDADRIAIWGESAGGYLASMAAVTSDDAFTGVTFTGEENLPEKVSGRVSVLLDYYGIIDFEQKDADYRSQGVPRLVVTAAAIPLNRNLQGYDSVEDLWLRKAVEDLTQTQLLEMNAGYHARKNLNEDSDLHVLICHGDADLSVPYAQSERLAATLKQPLGAEQVTFQLFENYKHADDRFYSDEALGDVKTYLDTIFIK